MAGAAHQGDTGGERNHGAQCSEPARRLVDRPLDSLPFFAAGPSQGKKRPPGGQQAEGAAWGLFLPPGRPKAKSGPLGGSKPKAQRGGNSYQPDTQSEREWNTISTFQAMVATRACRHV
ncbi:hypothetical protein BRI9_3323 [plant metagenome]|uniref:Uncharacterized protein n=1 Tax=plant metagenome TaxID=1297885 RepID=A0A484U7J1_9ZZZZ